VEVTSLIFAIKGRVKAFEIGTVALLVPR